MTLQTFPHLEQRTDEWLQARAGVLTASVVGRFITERPVPATDFDCPECDAPADSPCVSKARKEPAPIKTVHAARTDAATASGKPPLLVVADSDLTRGMTATLAAERITGHVEETPMTNAMWRGREEEPLARAFYNQHHAPVAELGFMIRTFDNGHSLGYSPDGLVGTDGLIEIKSRMQKIQLLTFLDDEVPAENMAQIQAGLLVSGREWLDYVAFCGGMPLYVKRVTPDPRWFAAILAALDAFEATAADMTDKYRTRTEGLPLTERPPAYAEIRI